MTALSFCPPFCSDMFNEFNRTRKFKDKKFYKSFIKLGTGVTLTTFGDEQVWNAQTARFIKLL